MLPILVDLGFFKLYTFGVFLVLAFFWGSFFLWKNILLTSFKEEDIFDGLFFSLAGGLLISRIVYVFLHFDTFGFDLVKFFLINANPGLSLYGGIIGVFVSLYLFIMTKKMKFIDVVDYTITPALLSLALGKLGGFFAGTEVGAQTKFYLAVKYANYDGLRHITAFYESLLFFVGAFIAYKLLFAVRRDVYDKGFVFIFFWWFVSLVLFIFEPLKSAPAQLFGQSFNFAFSAIILLTLSVYLVYYFRAAITSRFMHVIHLQKKSKHHERKSK